MAKLNLGCGKLLMKGWVNVDIRGGQVIADAAFLPFRRHSFDEVLTSHVLEHVDDLGAVMNEIHRVLRRGGILKARVPYGLKGLYDPFHRHAFGLDTLNPFCRDDPNTLDYAPLFRMLRREITDYMVVLLGTRGRGPLWEQFPGLAARFLRKGRDGKIRSSLPLGSRNEITFVLERV